MNWLLTGYYGLGNFGDDVMLSVLARELGRLDPEGEVSVLLARNGRAGALPAPARERCTVVPDDGPWSRVGAVRASDAVVYGGGTCLHERGFCALETCLLARLLGKRVAWIGVGMEPITSSGARLRARVALRTPHLIGFREADSLGLARKLAFGNLSASVTGDLAFLELPRAGAAATPGDRDAPAGPLVVAWRDLSAVLREDSATRASRAAAAAVARVARILGARRVRVVVLADRVDLAASRQFTSFLGRELEGDELVPELEEGLTLEEKQKALEAASFVVSGRLHGLMAAKLAGVPAVGLGYAEKVGRLGGELERSPVLPLEGLLEGPGGLVALAERELADPSGFRDLDGLVAGARRNLDLLAELLP